MKKVGYILKILHDDRSWTPIYWSIQELRLQCGEVPGNEIELVTVEFKELEP